MADNPQAFPRTIQQWNGHLTAREGMTLRDWFAGQALAVIGNSSCPSEHAFFAYELADAMLAERAKDGDA